MRFLAPGLLACLIVVPSARAQEDKAPADSPYVRLLKSGRLPAERLGVAINGIGQRGGVNDLAYLFGRVVDPGGFPPTVRPSVLDVLAEASLNRKLTPTGDLGGLAKILAEPKVEPDTLRAAIRLAGVWKVEAAAPAVRSVAADPKADLATRATAFDALAALGGAADRAAIEAAIADPSPGVSGRAVAALAKVDVKAAADRAVALIGSAKPGQDLGPVLAAFVDLRGGATILAESLGRQAPAADPAKLALRALYAIGHADEPLVVALSQAAGIEAESKPLAPAEMDRLLADIATTGDPARGEAIFRRAELNCTKCHSIGSAGGGVGPDLSAVGVSSPNDYLVNSILLPDLAIKEVYETLMVLTDDGRVFQGIVVEKDDTKIVLKDATAEVRSIPASSVEETKSGGSLMPKGLANLLTRAEFVDLVRFLSELGKPGPYAVQTTPTVHRWRVSSDAADLPADGGAISLPAYSRANGDLPLAEVAAEVQSATILVQAEITASAAGPVLVQIDSPEGVHAILNTMSFTSAQSAPSMAFDLVVGKNLLTLNIDTKARKKDTIKVEIVRAEGSPAEFAIVVGK